MYMYLQDFFSTQQTVKSEEEEKQPQNISDSQTRCGCCNQCAPSLTNTRRQRTPSEPFMMCFKHRPYLCAYGCFDCKVPVCLKCTKQEHNKHTICELFELSEESTTFAKTEKIGMSPVEKSPSRDSVVGSEVHKGYELVINQANKQAVILHSMVDAVLQDILNSVKEMKFRDLEYVEKIEKEFKLLSTKYDDNNSPKNTILNAEEIIYQREENRSNSVSEKIKFRAPRFLEGNPNIKDMKAQFGIIKSSVIERRKQRARKMMSKPILLLTINSRSKYTLYVKYYHSNMILQSGTGPELYILNEEGGCLDTIQTTTGLDMPAGLAVMDDGTILYSDYCHKRVRIMKSDKSEETLCRVEGKPNGICCTRSSDVIVCLQDCFESKGKVVRYDHNGNLKQEFMHQYLKSPTAVCENINYDICITEESMRKVIVIDKEMDIRFMYDGNVKSSEFMKFTPRDICSDSFGQILVADFSNRVIHMIDEDGHFIKYLLTKEDELSYPHGLCVDSENRLWVAERFSKKIKVFQYLSS